MEDREIKPIIVAVDFDSTCVGHTFPGIGKDIGAVPVLKKLVEAGHQLILWTLRCDHEVDYNEWIPAGDHLTESIEWFKQNDIPLFGIKENPDHRPYPGAVKPYYHLLIDDNALGCPLKTDLEISERPFVDWAEVEKWLIQNGIL